MNLELRNRKNEIIYKKKRLVIKVCCQNVHNVVVDIIIIIVIMKDKHLKRPCLMSWTHML